MKNIDKNMTIAAGRSGKVWISLILVLLLFLVPGICVGGTNNIPMPEKLKGSRLFKNEVDFHLMPEYCKARFYPGKSALNKNGEKGWAGKPLTISIIIDGD